MGRAILIFAVLTAIALGQPPVHVDYKCSDDEIQVFGLTCSTDEPCPVYLELTSLEPLGAKLFLTGNFHTSQVTLDSILLMSADSGRTWTEPNPRLRSASLEQVQFVDLEKGWVGGETIQSLPRDPFFLITTDGGNTWLKHPIFEEDRVASIVQFWFDSPANASLVIQAGPKYELYETRTAGSTWTPLEVKETAIRLPQSRTKMNPDWRLRADAPSQTYRVERREAEKWIMVASFPIHVADCKPADTVPAPPAPETDAASNPAPANSDATPADSPKRPRKPPTLKKPSEQP